MNRIVAVVAAAGIVASVLAAPAAAKKKPVIEEWQVTAAPYPGAQDHTDPPTECGVEGVTYAIHDFTTPYRGQLDVQIEFQGEWDLYVTDGDGNLLGSSVAFTNVTQERVVLPLGPKVDIQIYACNFLGAPTAAGRLEFRPR